MTPLDKEHLDKFETELEKERERLFACHKEMNKKSCMTCDRFIGCDTRNSYVKAVYLSMNKGVNGGFEF